MLSKVPFEKRNFVKMLIEICKEDNINIEKYGDSWFFRLSINDMFRHIIGYRFELNSSAIDIICGDKCATSDILCANHIPCIEHKFFLSFENLNFINDNGTWGNIIEYFEKYNKVVCKPNDGRGGKGVEIANNRKELEKIVSNIFSKSRGLAMCPFYDINEEYRLILLNGKVELIFTKTRPTIIGNGKDTVLKLIIDSDNKFDIKSFDENMDYSYIPRENEKKVLTWKHNLELGSSAIVVQNQEKITQLTTIALKASKILNLKFASIDIVEIGNEYKILEINSGVSMEYFSKCSNENYEKAKSIYKKAISLMFNL